MSETRQLWNPWRAKTRIAASRICRLRSTAWALAMAQRLHGVRPAIRVGAAIGERWQRAANPVLPVEVDLGGGDALAVGRDREDDAPGIDDHRAPVGVEVRRRLAVLTGGDHERLVLDRPGAQQDLPVVAPGVGRERRGHAERASAADREDPVELGEPKVVADGQAQLEP